MAKVGRPKKDDSLVQKHVVSCKLSDKEFEQFEKYCALQQKTKAVCIREHVLEDIRTLKK